MKKMIQRITILTLSICIIIISFNCLNKLNHYTTKGIVIGSIGNSVLIETEEGNVFEFYTEIGENNYKMNDKVGLTISKNGTRHTITDDIIESITIL